MDRKEMIEALIEVRSALSPTATAQEQLDAQRLVVKMLCELGKGLSQTGWKRPVPIDTIRAGETQVTLYRMIPVEQG